MNTDRQDRSDIFSSPQLTQLLGLAVEDDAQEPCGDPSRQIARQLRDRLAGPMPMSAAVVEALPVIVGKLQDKLLPHHGRPLGELLLDEHTSLETFQAIKEYGKKLAARQDSEADHAVGVAVYYAAIASALLFHKEKITTHSNEYLAASFENVQKQEWLPVELRKHLKKAERKCC